ncbi:MAG: hypothetical protein KDI98_04425 [Hyphomicrobiaceae bacterium]|nr:hypothetical protein [Hyphomicrobiaceae bacterium]
MIRIFLINAVFFALPFLLYALWVAIRREKLSDAPYLWLLSAAVASVLIGMIVLGQFGTSSRTGVYVPPELRDGQIVPGHVVEPGE